MTRRAILILLLTVILVLPAATGAEQGSQPTLYWGVSGPSVRTLQARLAQWGYYRGSVDGIFGTGTSLAVQGFQRKNGLSPDGVVGPATWRALGLGTTAAPSPARSAPTQTVGAPVSANTSLNLLSRLVAAEARSEPYSGQVAVAAVILNRINDPRFPKSVSGVVFQPHAFESVSNGLVWQRSPTQQEINAARAALNGWDPTYGSIFFWNPSKPVSGWIWSRPIKVRIGSHVFAI